MLMELVFIACLAGPVERCRPVRIPMEEGAQSPIGCMTRGQMELAAWLDENAGYRPRPLPGSRAIFRCAPVR
jgi:hypothetical protein